MILLMAGLNASAAILEVALDGSQPYTVIQTAIDASAHGDTVLVHPGRYYENVQFNGKNITLASLELPSGDPDYKYLTIIDGNQNGPVVRTTTGETNISIRGFTITNGTGDYNSDYDMTVGGGIIVSHMTGQRAAAIVNCHVTANCATNGGGFWGGGCYLTLSGVSLSYNHASAGGGLYFYGSVITNYDTTFDPANRCSIYSNYAAFGSDMYYYNVNSVDVVVDTFTVADPWNFYATAVPSNPNISNPYTFDILHTVHEEVNHDLYVAPWGDDANSGLSPSEPMQTVFMALYRVASDSENPKTVHVANGHYSPSLNNQLFPIPVKSHTRLVGETKEGVILDAGGQGTMCSLSAHSQGLMIKNVTFQNGRSGIESLYSYGYSIIEVNLTDISDVRLSSAINDYGTQGIITLEDILITNVESPSVRGIFSGFSSGSIVFKRVEVKNCSANERLMAIEISTRGESDILIDGCSIHDNHNYSPDVFNTMFQISPFDDNGTRLRVEMRNSAFYDNHQVLSAQMGMARSLNDTLFIENCTFAGNTGGSGTVMVQGTSVLTNNIFHNPDMATQLWIPNYSSPNHTTLRYNNILGGMGGVYNASPANPLIWGEGNTALDPLFAYEGNRPYTLGPGSPLIDAGWQWPSGLAEPAYDAGGNERLWDGDGDGIPVIDKGAYEYQPLHAPIGLMAETSGANVFLDWEMPRARRGLAGYRIYRNGNAHAQIDDPALMLFRDHIVQTDTLSYHVVALYGDVESPPSNTVTVYVEVVPNDDGLDAPGLDYLLICPNPFSEMAVLRLGLSRASGTRVEIRNLRGQKVKIISEGRLGKGEHVLWWNADDDSGREVANGIYFCHVYQDNKLALSRKIVYIK
ncbi:MAG: DUF1565 domain-containing protein [Candidatus Syntrophosphaera sp.]